MYSHEEEGRVGRAEGKWGTAPSNGEGKQISVFSQYFVQISYVKEKKIKCSHKQTTEV